MGNAEYGLQPLRALGSIYEPEAGGAKMAYPPACKPMAYKPTGWKRPRRDFGLRKRKTGRPGYKKDERPTSNIEWKKMKKQRNVEYFDFGRPWPPARSLRLGERAGLNLLASKARKKELELI